MQNTTVLFTYRFLINAILYSKCHPMRTTKYGIGLMEKYVTYLGQGTAAPGTAWEFTAGGVLWTLGLAVGTNDCLHSLQHLKE
jgi:hypothetical protein